MFSSAITGCALLHCVAELLIPLPVDVPQRGKVGIKYYLMINVKT
jgi:hypothetical protein